MAVSLADSSTGGYLNPTSPPPTDDLDLDTLIGTLIAGVTGLDGDHVFPRWQETQPRIPDGTETWVSVGVNVSTPDDTPAQIHHADGDGYTVLRTFYRLDVLASFYGRKSDAYAKLTRDSLYVDQNRETMRAGGLNLVGFDPIRRIPEISATHSRRRSDLAFRLTQTVERTYGILNVLEADGTVIADGGTPAGQTIITTPFKSPRPAV